jgi:membrane protein DedA with SNARE-associated domain
MVLDNMDIIGVIIAAAIAGVGSGIGVAIGQALYKALLEDKINKFLDKKHREEALQKLKNIDPTRSILFGNNPPKPIDPESVVDKMVGNR